MKRIHLPEPDTAYITSDGRELVALPLDDCDDEDCRLEHHWLIPDCERLVPIEDER